MSNALNRILLFCGAFDPITSGHMLMLNLCIKTTFFNEIRILPSGKRLDKKYKTEDDHRYNMCEIAMNVFKKDYSNLNIKCSKYEMELAEPKDSYFTIKHFQDTEPGNEFYFFMGSDILPEMFHWPHSNDLIEITNFLIALRQGVQIKQEDLNRLKSYKLLDGLLQQAGQQSSTSPASSTEARNALQDGTSCKDLLHPDVLKYVKDHKLYPSTPYTSDIYP